MEICREMEKEVRVAELKELEDIFTALEEDRRNLQNLLQEKDEETEMKLRAMEREMVHERVELETKMRDREEALERTREMMEREKALEMKWLEEREIMRRKEALELERVREKGRRDRKEALERERVQERVEWEREMREREEALLPAFISVVLSKDKVMKDLMDRPSPSKVISRHLQDNSESTMSDLQEDRVKITDVKKQEKALQQAEKKAQKAEKKRGFFRLFFFRKRGD